MEEDESGRLADARTGGDALNRVTPAQGGFASEEQRAERGMKLEILNLNRNAVKIAGGRPEVRGRRERETGFLPEKRQATCRSL
jgi:hypothetical protein